MINYKTQKHQISSSGGGDCLLREVMLHSDFCVGLLRMGYDVVDVVVLVASPFVEISLDNFLVSPSEMVSEEVEGSDELNNKFNFLMKY